MDPELITVIASDFVSPLRHSDGQSVGVLAAAFQKGVLKRLSRSVQGAPQLLALDRGLLADMRSATGPDVRWWQPEAGATARLLSIGQPRTAMAQVLFGLHAQGLDGRWSLHLPQPERFSFAGHIFTLDGDVEVACEGGRIDVATPTSRLWLARRAAGWDLEAVASADGALGYSEPIFLRFPGFQDRYVQGWIEPAEAGRGDFIVHWPPAPFEDAAFVVASARALDDALALLQELGPAYLPWLRALFRGVAASPQRRPGIRQGASHTWHAGVFSCGFPRSEESIAEAIVQEISHQYLLLLSASFPLIEPGETRMYSSSVEGRPRPLDRLLLGFHASANMALYWRDVMDQYGAQPMRTEAFELRLARTLQFQGELSRAEGITAAGRVVIAQQAELLDAGGLTSARSQPGVL